MRYCTGESSVCRRAAPQAAAAPCRGLAVLLPGFGYGPDKPLLHYARKAALAAGFTDQSHLTRRHAEAFGMTPAHWRGTLRR